MTLEFLPIIKMEENLNVKEEESELVSAFSHTLFVHHAIANLKIGSCT